MGPELKMISNTKVTYQYSPIPMRYYLKKADGLSTWPTSFVFKRKSAAEWNLTWLLYPGVDEALSITDSNSFDAHHNDIRQRFIKIRHGIKNILNKSTLDENGLGLKSALVSLPASDFALYLQDAPLLLQALETVCQEDVLALVQARAIQSVEGRLHYRLGGYGGQRKKLQTRSYAKAIRDSEEARCRWLHRATDLLREYYQPRGIVLPRVTFQMDTYTLSRMGYCQRRLDGNTNRIAISPMYVECTSMYITLVHELVHAVDDCVNGHYPKFIKLANQMGLIGQHSSGLHLSEELAGVCAEISSELGIYPHFDMSYKSLRVLGRKAT